MFEYCVRELHMSEDAAYKRIRAARTARQFPAIFGALAEGRLHLSAVVLLAPHLTPETAGELLAAAEHQTKAEIEQLLARRFPQPDLATMVRAIPPVPRTAQGAAGAVETPALPLAARLGASSEASHAATVAMAVSCQLAPGPVGMTDTQQVMSSPASEPRARVAPLAPERFALQVTIGQETHDELRYARELLGHALPAGDLAQVLDRALDALIDKLERRKFSAGARTRPGSRHGKSGTRHVPAAVRREVWQRDGGRCTFLSETGHRCDARARLELDHVQPVARGGETTAANLRLRCRTHNQHAAEVVFGAGFMARRRREARTRVAGTHDAMHERQATLEGERAAAGAEGERNADVIPWLRRLGFRADEARRAAALCEAISDAPLEERVRHALRHLARGGARQVAPAASATR